MSEYCPFCDPFYRPTEPPRDYIVTTFRADRTWRCLPGATGLTRPEAVRRAMDWLLSKPVGSLVEIGRNDGSSYRVSVWMVQTPHGSVELTPSVTSGDVIRPNRRAA